MYNICCKSLLETLQKAAQGGNILQNRIFNRVAFLRRQAGLTQSQLAKEMGVPPQWISKIERGEIETCNISLLNGLKLSAALNVSPWELVR